MIWILIVIGIIGGFFYFKSKQTASVEVFENNLIRELHSIFNNAKHSEIDENELKLVAMKIYRLSFWKVGKTPYDLTQISLEPSKLIATSEYLTFYESILTTISKMCNVIYNSSHHTSLQETSDTLGIIVKQIGGLIKRSN